MCYSASASFVASGGLALVGGASLTIASKKERVLAFIPIFFSIQQALEGIQWLFLDQGSVCRAAGYGFLFFALLLWPMYLPMVVYIVDRARRPLIRYFIIAGICMATWYGYLLTTTPLVIQVFGRHIFYSPPGPLTLNFIPFLYVAVTVGVLLISSKRALRIDGILALVSAILTVFISQIAAASVWCFFAACISISIYVMLRYHSLSRD